VYDVAFVNIGQFTVKLHRKYNHTSRVIAVSNKEGFLSEVILVFESLVYSNAKSAALFPGFTDQQLELRTILEQPVSLLLKIGFILVSLFEVRFHFPALLSQAFSPRTAIVNIPSECLCISMTLLLINNSGVLRIHSMTH
jgi:hypothetical protein